MRCARATSLASSALASTSAISAGKGTLDPADIGIFRVVIDVDHRREIIVDAELRISAKLAVRVARLRSGARWLNSFALGNGAKPRLSFSRRTRPPSWSMNTIGPDGSARSPCTGAAPVPAIRCCCRILASGRNSEQDRAAEAIASGELL